MREMGVAWFTALPAGAGRLPRTGVDAVVHRRPAEHRAQLPGPLGRYATASPASGRARTAPRAPSPSAKCARRPIAWPTGCARSGLEAGRPRGALPADGAGDPVRFSTAASRPGSPWCRSSRASAPGAIATRLEDSGARVLFTADYLERRGKRLPLAAKMPAVRRHDHRAGTASVGRIPGRAIRRVRRRYRWIPRRAPSSSTPPAPPASRRARCTRTPDAWRKWARKSGSASTIATTTASSGSATSAG